MSDAWDVEELISRYEFHPEFRDVFVEGEDDSGFYGWFMEVTGRSDVTTYPISAVEIAEGHDLWGLDGLDTSSNRSNVILLAVALEKEIPTAEDRVTCIADADTQHVNPVEFTSRFLLFTDYTGAELYAYRPEPITKLVRIGSPTLTLTGEEVLGEITPLLQSLFCFRVANYELRWGLTWPSHPLKECTYDNSKIIFDDKRFVHKYLNTNGKLRQEAQFWEKVAEVRARFMPDCRLQIRAHDFVEVLSWYLRKRSQTAFQHHSPEIVRQSLMCQIRVEDLTGEALFQKLLRKYPATTPHGGGPEANPPQADTL